MQSRLTYRFNKSKVYDERQVNMHHMKLDKKLIEHSTNLLIS